MNVKNVVNNKKFCKIVKTFFFSNKSSSFKKISLIEKDRVITDDSEIIQISNSTSLTVLDFGLKVPDAITYYSPTFKDPILNATAKYQNLPSIKTTIKKL